MRIIKNLLIIIFIILISTFILIFLNKEFKNNYSDWRVVYTKSFLNDSYNLVIYAEDNGRKDFSHSSLEPNINYDDKQKTGWLRFRGDDGRFFGFVNLK